MAKAKQVASWGDIPQAAFKAFYEAVMKLREEMIPRDCDRDHPIDIVIVNRMEHEPINYLAVPHDEVYSYVTHGYLQVHPDKQEEMTDETEKALTVNVHMATEALERHMRLKQHRNWRKREAHRPFADRIKEACPLCKKKVAFDPDNPHDFYKESRGKFADYPARYHENDQECKAFDLRRSAFYAAHPEEYGEPEPRWCMNPNCRCKLPEHDSKKGKKDKNICVNPRCGLDNSKHYPEVTNAD